MFGNIGKKLKIFAIIILFVGVVSAILFGVLFIFKNIFAGVLIMFYGILASLLLSYVIYGFGVYIEDLKNIKDSLNNYALCEFDYLVDAVTKIKENTKKETSI